MIADIDSASSPSRRGGARYILAFLLLGLLEANAARAALILSAPRPSGSDRLSLANCTITPDSRWAVFRLTAYPNVESRFARRIDGSGDLVSLLGNSVNDASLLQAYLGSAADGRRAIYGGINLDELGFKTYTQSMIAAHLSVPLPQGGFDAFPNWLVSPNGLDLARRVTATSENSDSLYVVRADGSAPAVTASPTFPGTQYSIETFAWSQSGRRLVYQVSVPTTGQHQFYSFDTAAGGAPVLLNDSANAIGKAEFAIAPDERSVAFFAGRQSDEGWGHLMTRPIDGSGETRVVSGRMLWSTYPTPMFRYAAGGAMLCYLSSYEDTRAYRLYITPTDGSSAPRTLSSDNVTNMRVTADGSRIIYAADTKPEDPYLMSDALFSQPVDGTPRVQLNAGLTNRATDLAFWLLDGGRRVVFGSDTGYWSSEADGVGARVALGPGGAKLAITPNERYMVYLVNLDGDDAYEAICAQSTLGGPSEELAEVAASGQIVSFQISPDSNWVVFTGTNSSGVFELYSVEIPEPSALLFLATFGMAMALRRRR